MTDKLNRFLGTQKPPTEPVSEPVGGMEWEAAVQCQTCAEDVYLQTLYPAEFLLVWDCSQGHRSRIEGYSAF